MILFYENWNRYPTAFPDLKTSNKSFLRLAGVYKKMGIKNHAFLLALHDPKLQGVDPFDENLSPEMVTRIGREIKVNPWYFFREIARAPSNSGSGSNPIRANRSIISLIWLFFNHITNLVIQPRQTGKSFGTDTLMTCLMLITENTRINLLTKDDKLRVSNVMRLKRIYECLPWYLQLKQTGDTNSTEQITINALGNVYLANIGQASAKAALNMGRGMTIPINQIDEINFVKNIQITLGALLASGGAVRDEAKEKGEPYGNIFTSTAGYLDTPEGEYVYNTIFMIGMRWTELLFDCIDEADLVKIIRKNSSSRSGTNGKVLVISEFNHRELGYTDAWLAQKIEDAMCTVEEAKTDFLNIWSVGKKESPFNKKTLEVVNDSLMRVVRTTISKQGYITRWYVTEEELEHLLKTSHLVLSTDTSEALGNDDIALHLKDAKSGAVVAAGNYNETNVITYSEWLADWIETYENLTLIIERRSTGPAIIDNLLLILPARGIDPFKRMFNWIVHEADMFPDRIDEVFSCNVESRDPFLYTKYKKHFGYATSAGGRSSRDNIYNEALISAMSYTGAGVRDEYTINQIRGLVVKHGRIDHRTGGKDDMVISWSLGHWFLLLGKFKEHYGINTNIVLTEIINASIDDDNDGMTREHRAKLLESQRRLKQRIDNLLDALRKEHSETMIDRLTNKIKFLSKDIDSKLITNLNINNLLENISREKNKNKKKDTKSNVYKLNRKFNTRNSYLNRRKNTVATI